ncbi:RNA polymerase sigma factor (sigma-70 family) [Brevundimonas nasdae]|uniref:RNA polymerase sigma factor n=1 Tax=Brevundimonas nasdae TaxID=172043 RepID=UPI001912D97D|nr:sigma-70 family RNA polymerase sigma factor [Brevundimonas nasdae]MBK6025442.1 sigma-70 family RNA polymerase sigma factor [Brevundimonas nasdae]MDQ0452073.1 RNA polymerase sigma factor (sigma-70 family) [Brevundimonas nasdae]
MRLRPSRLWRGRREVPEDRERRTLIRAIRSLPRDCRDVLLLHRIAELSLEQIAEHLGIDQQAVEAGLAEALVRLSRAVDEAGGGGASERS